MLQQDSVKTSTPDAKGIIDYILTSITSDDGSTLVALADLALQQNDFRLWARVFALCSADKNLDRLGKKRTVSAWNKFSFQSMRAVSSLPFSEILLLFLKAPLSFESALQRCHSTSGRMKFVEFIRSCVRQDVRNHITTWCDVQVSLALSSLRNLTPEDVPTLMAPLRQKGSKHINDTSVLLIPGPSRLMISL
jgi:hypothetical protein